MTNVLQLLEHPVTLALGWAIIHSCWQGLIVVAIAATVAGVTKNRSASLRYVILCSGLLAALIGPVLTCGWVWMSLAPTDAVAKIDDAQMPSISERHAAPIERQTRIDFRQEQNAGDELEAQVSIIDVEGDPSAVPKPRSISPTPLLERLRQSVAPTLPWCVAGWLLGVLILSARLLASWRGVRRLRQMATTPVRSEWQLRMIELANRLKVRQTIRLLESRLVDVPTVVGWLRPMILVPVSAMTGLDGNQLEALLAHELAHIRRHDYLVNIVQTVIETLLFYHPAVWWLSRRIRDERENCCDDLAVEVCGDSMIYARALATMESLRPSHSLVMAADGGSLLARIRRVVASSTTPQSRSAPSGFLVLFVIALCVLALFGGSRKQNLAAAGPAVATSAVSDPDLDAQLRSVVESVRAAEEKFQDYSASLMTTRDIPAPANGARPASLSGGRAMLPARWANSIHQNQNGKRFKCECRNSESYADGSSSEKTLRSVCDGETTVAVDEGIGVTRYPGSAEPIQMMPPHCWGIFHLAVSCPLSVLLTGGEAVRTHPKIGRHPMERGSIFELYKVESEVVGHEAIDGLDTTIVRLHFWRYTSNPPEIQYLWLAKDRGMHVIQSRTSYVREGVEVFSSESRVKKWRKLPGDVWYPQEVEVFDISPTSVENQTLEKVMQSLSVHFVKMKPTRAAEEFRLPVLDADLPKLAVDNAGFLVESPHHPTAIAGKPSTTLDAILDRLATEEAKYEPCEVVTVDNYRMLHQGSLIGAMTGSMTNRTSISAGTRRYQDEVVTSATGLQQHITVNRQATDGSIKRSYGSSKNIEKDSGKAGDVRNWAMIELGKAKNPVPLDRAHTLMFQKGGGAANSMTLAEYLRDRQFDQRNSQPMTVEYVGDEQIDGLVCHKLKCTLKSADYFLLWLVRDRNLLPIRHEWHELSWHPTLLTGMTYCEGVHEIQPGVWFPSEVIHLAFQKSSHEGLNFGRISLQWRSDLTVESVTLNPTVNDQLFSEITVPAGTQVSVRDESGQYLGPYSQAEEGRLEISEDKLRELREKVKGGTSTAAQSKAVAGEQDDLSDQSHGRFADTPTGRLLHRLERQYATDTAFTEVWLRTMKQIVDLGSDAVPELIAELDATNEDRMLRSTAFLLRAIADKRAVPALVRAIPRTLRKMRSDMGFNAFDPELKKFARENQLDPKNPDPYYTFGRPVREVGAALEKLTDQKFDEETLYRVFLNGLPSEQRQKRMRFQHTAEKWAEWWEQNWARFVTDEQYWHVNLPPLAKPQIPDGSFDTAGDVNGLLLQPVTSQKAKSVFYDLDSNRTGELPERWRDDQDISAHLDEIVAWATEEGYDLMGTEYVDPASNEPVFTLRLFGGRAWELTTDFWKRPIKAVTLDRLREGSAVVKGMLLRHDKSSGAIDPKANATFLVITSESTPAVLYVGVEVRDDTALPGHFFPGDPDLNPRSTAKGRRISIRYLEPHE